MSKKKNLNIADILRDCPSGTELYSLVSGEVILHEVVKHSDVDVIVCKHKGFSDEAIKDHYLANGAINRVGECVLFPSKEIRDWKKFEKPIVIEEYGHCVPFWYKITADKKKNKALMDKLVELVPDTTYMYKPNEEEFKEGRIVYNNFNSIKVVNDVDNSFAQVVKMFGIRLHVKGDKL